MACFPQSRSCASKSSLGQPAQDPERLKGTIEHPCLTDRRLTSSLCFLLLLLETTGQGTEQGSRVNTPCKSVCCHIRSLTTVPSCTAEHEMVLAVSSLQPMCGSRNLDGLPCISTSGCFFPFPFAGNAPGRCWEGWLWQKLSACSHHWRAH